MRRVCGICWNATGPRVGPPWSTPTESPLAFDAGYDAAKSIYELVGVRAVIVLKPRAPVMNP